MILHRLLLGTAALALPALPALPAPLAVPDGRGFARWVAHIAPGRAIVRFDRRAAPPDRTGRAGLGVVPRHDRAVAVVRRTTRVGVARRVCGLVRRPSMRSTSTDMACAPISARG